MITLDKDMVTTIAGHTVRVEATPQIDSKDRIGIRVYLNGKVADTMVYTNMDPLRSAVRWMAWVGGMANDPNGGGDSLHPSFGAKVDSWCAEYEADLHGWLSDGDVM